MEPLAVLHIAAGIVLGWASALAGEELDGELMRKIAGGDERAFERLYDRYHRQVFGMLLRMSRDRGKAEDLLQEVFLTLWRQAARFDARAASALPWLMVMARNRALDGVRSAAARREQGADDAGLEWAGAARAQAASARYEAGFAEREALERIRAAMAELSADERRVIEMAYFEGCSQSEIGERIGSPLGTVKTWTRSGLAKLRKALP